MTHFNLEYFQGNSESALDIDRMNEITDEACELFLSKFPVCFEDELYKKFEEIRRESHSAPITKLTDHPKLQFPLKNDILFKRGGNIKNWKRRHFVALNEADNYNIVYYKMRHGKLYRRGVIPCNG